MSARPPATVVSVVALLALAALGSCRQRSAQEATAPHVGPALPTPVPTRIFLFFPGDDAMLHREMREVPEVPGATASRIRAVMEELLGGSQRGFAPAFTWAATVEAVFVDRGGNAYVDLSPPPDEAVEGSNTEVTLVYAVVNTVVANCPGVERVQLLFGGREVATLGHLDLSRPLAAQPQLVFSQ